MISHVPASEQRPEPPPSRARRVLRAVARFFTVVFGTWTPPAWSRRAGGFSLRHKKRLGIGAAIVAVVSVVVVGVQRYIASLPQPDRATVSLQAPTALPEYDPAKDKRPLPAPLVLMFDRAVGPLEVVGKEPAAGTVVIEPPIEGAWKWTSDHELVFAPTTDWPIGTDYEIHLEKGLVAPHVELEKDEVSFSTEPLSATIQSRELYEDPRDPRVHKIIATIAFNYPIDPASLSEHLRLTFDGETDDRPLKYDLTQSAGRHRAFVTSETVAIPLRDAAVQIVVEEGVRAALPGAPLKTMTTTSVPVPGQYTFFHVASSQLSFVDNEKHEPERVFFLTFTTGVEDQALDAVVEAYVLPRDRPATAGNKGSAKYHWADPSEIGSAILQASKKLELKSVPTDDPGQRLHTYRFDVDEGAYVYVRVKKGVKSVGGYVLAEEYAFISRATAPPKTIEFMSRGALLSLQGERKVPLVSRAVEVIDARVARFRSDSLHHLLSQTDGRFENPRFVNYLFTENNIAEVFHKDIPAAARGDATTKYTTLDLGPLFDAGQRGLFLVELTEKPPKNAPIVPHVEEEEYEGGEEGGDAYEGDGYEGDDGGRVFYRGGRGSDRRLLLITDLGILWKKSVDGSGDVFVQSIHDGAPIAAARVSILSLNGTTLVERTTDGDGHAALPRPDHNLPPEKRPIAVVVEKGRDLSFIPWNRFDRDVDTSRFDVGGAVSTSSRGLEATLFSDRGLYRPGEAIHIGGIVKNGGWSGSTAGVPMELVFTNPAGAEVTKTRVSLPATGFFEEDFSTRETSPTGSYLVTLYTVKDGRRYSEISSTPVRVEEFEPDRMKIRAALSDARVDGWVSPEKLAASVHLENLFGTPAEGRNVEATLDLRPASPRFARYADYSFSDVGRAKQSFSESLGQQTTDKNGDARFELGLERFAAGTYYLAFTAEGFDVGGGRAVVARAGAYVSPRKFVVGAKGDGTLHLIPKGAARKLEIIAVDAKLDRVAVGELKLKRIEERFVSVLTRREDGTYAYQSKQRSYPKDEKPLSLPATGAKIDVPTDEPGDFVFVVEDAEGNELHRVGYSVSGTTRLGGNLEKNAELDVKLDKADYAGGDTIRVRVLAPYVGAGLITIERERVFAHKWFRSTTNAFEETIELPKGVEGNAYVHVSYLRDPHATEVFTSPLSSGVAPFSIDRNARTIQVDLKTSPRIQPGDSIDVVVKTDQPARVVVFGVDEGILQLAHYEAPDPLSYFLRKRALQVRTSQILDLVMPEHSVLSAAAGGDASGALGKNLNPFRRKTDKPAVFWSGIVDVGEGGKKLSFPIPETFDGNLKVMAVAVNEKAIGTGKSETVVRGHFVISPSAPLFLAPGDEAVVTLGIANLVEGAGAGLAVDVKATASGNLSVVDGGGASLVIDEGREQVHKLRVKAGDAPGTGTVAVVVGGKGKSTRRSVELSIRPASPYRVDVKAGWVKSSSVNVQVPRRLHDAFRTLEASMSSLPLGMATGIARYLDAYPYGCTEQLVSRAVPAIVAKARPEFAAKNAPTADIVQNAMEVLAARQNGEGAFGLWADTTSTPPFLTLYATHVLIDAKEHGVVIPHAVLQRALRYIEQASRHDAPTPLPPRLRAYALYLEARSGKARGPDVQKLAEELRAEKVSGWQQDLTGLYMAAAWKIAKDDVRASDVFGGSKLFDPQTPDPSTYYDQNVRDAQYLYILSKHFPEALRYVNPDDVARLVDNIASRGLTSLTASYALLALDAYASAAQHSGKSAFTIAEVTKDKSAALALDGGDIARASFHDAADKLVLRADGDVAGFYSVVEGGFDTTPPTDRVADGIEIFRELRGADGKPVTVVGVGDVVEVHLRLRSLTGGYPQVAIVDLVPGGFQVEMDKSVSGGGRADRLSVAGTTFSTESVDVREDRVVLYGTPSQTAQEYVYRLRAVTPGKFQMPPAFAEGMYDRAIFARAPSSTIEVR